MHWVRVLFMSFMILHVILLVFFKVLIMSIFVLVTLLFLFSICLMCFVKCFRNPFVTKRARELDRQQLFIMYILHFGCLWILLGFFTELTKGEFVCIFVGLIQFQNAEATIHGLKLHHLQWGFMCHEHSCKVSAQSNHKHSSIEAVDQGLTEVPNWCFHPLQGLVLSLEFLNFLLVIRKKKKSLRCVLHLSKYGGWNSPKDGVFLLQLLLNLFFSFKWTF